MSPTPTTGSRSGCLGTGDQTDQESRSAGAEPHFAEGEDAWQIVASGGGSHHPDWYFNLMAHPEQASIELAGRDAVHVTPQRLDGTDREQAWRRIAAAQPRIAKYQRKSDREYPGGPTHAAVTANVR